MATPRETKRQVRPGQPVKGDAAETPVNRRTRSTKARANPSEPGKRTGRGRGVAGMGEAPTRTGGVSKRNAGKATGASNRTRNAATKSGEQRTPVKRSGAVTATAGGRKGRRPKSGMQG